MGEFLAARRAELSPADVGLPVATRRRVKGLRREEVATRAGLSIEYYTRLEQGKARNPSPDVLHAIARALKLTDPQTRYILGLTSNTRFPTPGRSVRPELQALLDSMPDVVGVIYNHRMDILAWNSLFSALCFDVAAVPERDRNIARFDFQSPESRQRLVHWEDVCRATAGQLRLAAAQHPNDQELAHLIGELMLASTDFQSHWNAGDVDLRTHGSKSFRHPTVGEITLSFDTFEFPCGQVEDVRQIGQRLLTLYPTTEEARNALKLITIWEQNRTETFSPSVIAQPDNSR